MVVALAGCGTDRDTAERAELSDSMPVVKAMTNRAMADSMLDTMPGGEMARGRSTAERRLLKKKMTPPAGRRPPAASDSGS